MNQYLFCSRLTLPAALLCLTAARSCKAQETNTTIQSEILRGYRVVFEDNFARPDTASPDSIGNGWNDASRTWRLAGNTLVPTTTAASAQGHGATGPIRPWSESELNQGAELTTGPLPVSDSVTNIPYTLLLRIQRGSAWGTNHAVQFRMNPKTREGTVVLGPGGQWGPFKGVAGPKFPIVPGHSYILTATARNLYAGGYAILSYTVADASAPGVILAQDQSALAPMAAAFATNPGVVGLQQDRADLTRSDLQVVTRFRSFAKPLTSLNTVSSPLVAGTTGNIVTLGGANTNWTPATTHFSLTGPVGAAITRQEILTPTLARLTVSSCPTAGTLDISEAGTNSHCEIEVASRAAPLVVTNLMPVEAPAGEVRILGGVVTGGTPPYKFQWHRDLNWSFAPDASNALPGQTNLDLRDEPPTNQCYAYKLVVTDSSLTKPGASISPAAPGLRDYHPVPSAVFKPTSTHIPPLRIGWIGDSITSPASNNVSGTMKYLKAAGLTIESSTNRGISGSQSSGDGHGWMPTSTSGIYRDTAAAFKAANVNLMVLMLGTNEARGLGYIPTYKANLNTLLRKLNEDFPGVPVVLNTPALATRAAGGNDANETHIAFIAALDEIAAATPNATRGDRNMPVWSYGRYYEFADDIHPNTQGSDSYARYWADALLRALQTSHP